MLLLWALCASVAAQSPSPLALQITGDAVMQPLGDATGDAQSGRRIAQGRDGQCTLCHAMPDGDARAGTIGPPLAGVGARLSAGQLRLRLVDSQRINPDTLMPAYYRIEGLHQVAPAWRGKTILSGQQIEDLLAYLQTLR